jgi:phospholipase C
MPSHAVAHDAQHPAGGGKTFNHVFLLAAFADPLGGSAVQNIRGAGSHAAGGSD